ncbi:MAG: hypothetical protein P8N49_05995 [Opitutales bacterium]|mgnify:FL=1|nr:hypothetical protein [Opitutales bacterium]
MNIQNYKTLPDFMITMTDAARILGYKDYRHVEKLISQNHLKCYNIPTSKRPLLRYKDVMTLPKTTQDSGNN